MKKIITYSLVFAGVLAFSSCSSPYKKRKRCRGNGSWYGKRNLGMKIQKIDQQQTVANTISFVE